MSLNIMFSLVTCEFRVLCRSFLFPLFLRIRPFFVSLFIEQIWSHHSGNGIVVRFAIGNKNHLHHECLLLLLLHTHTRTHYPSLFLSLSLSLSLYIYIYIRRRSWLNVSRRRKWIQRPQFRALTKPFAFQIALILLGKVWIELFSLQWRVNSRADWFLNLGGATGLEEEKLYIQICLSLLKNWPCVRSCSRRTVYIYNDRRTANKKSFCIKRVLDAIMEEIKYK